jgi:hypothetical protein
MLDILAYFEQHHKVIECVDTLANRLSRVRSTEGLLHHIRIHGDFSRFEAGVGAGQFHDRYLKEINNALQKTGS